MANNYLDILLGKISAYDLFNVLIPGALVGTVKILSQIDLTVLGPVLF